MRRYYCQKHENILRLIGIHLQQDGMISGMKIVGVHNSIWQS